MEKMRAFRIAVNSRPASDVITAEVNGLVQAAAVAVYYYKGNERPFTLDTTITVQSVDPVQGGGTVTVGEILRWSRTAEGQVALADEPDNFRPVIEDLADELLAKT